jgi:Predicted membrane protein (DUF2207) C-terminal domain/Predicted membrane protein (DUF2207) N-terminal domain
MKTLFKIAGCIVVLGIALPAVGQRPAPPAEQILDYHTVVAVDAKGVMTVIETIRVVADHNQIKRGIYRDIPVRYPGGPMGVKVNVPIQIVRIERDGHKEPYHTERMGDLLRIYVGDRNVMVDKGEHVYVIGYTTKQVRFFGDHDELYWNATGNAWAFPIQKAKATVVLPADVPRDKVTHEGYVGPVGSKNQKDLRSWVDQKTGNIEYETTGPLSSGEGLTIVATFPKGHVAEPSAVGLVFDDPVVKYGSIGAAAVGVYFFVMWLLVGRDPAKKTIFPQYEAPEGMTPGAVRFVSRMEWDNTCFAATLLSLAVQGKLHIDEENGQYALTRVGKGGARAGDGLPAEEAQVFTRLLGVESKLAVKQTHHVVFSAAIDALKSKLKQAYEGPLFRSNGGWLAIGVLMSIAVFAGAAFMGGAFADGGAFFMLWLMVWTLGTAALVIKMGQAWRGVLRGTGGVGAAVFITLFALPFVAAEVFVAGLLAIRSSWWIVPLLLVLVAMCLKFYTLLKQPTVEGRRVMDAIDGLKMYLSTAERDRLEAMTRHATTRGAGGVEPERTIELFEKMLPYAVALGVENQWAGQFDDLLRAAAVDDSGGGGRGYQPTWYHGSNWSAMNVGAAVAGVGVAMSAAVASAATSPSSGSSGSGGGGSSGGGGGGGGGGGW